MQPTLIYTDGSCSGNPGKGAWAYKIIVPGKYEYMSGGHIPYTTNNYAEAMAVLQALKDHALAPTEAIIIHTDSQYVMCCLDRVKARRPVNTHKGLWQNIERALSRFSNVRWVKVRAHSGDAHNCSCDAYAKYHTKL